MMKTKPSIKPAKIIIIAVIAAFVLHQGYSVFYTPIKTETAVFDKYVSGINITGIMIRNETLVSSSAEGVNHFLISSGERVAKNSPIAEIYSSENDSIALTKIASLSAQKENIETIQKYNDLAAVDMDMVNGKISESLEDIIYLSSNSKFSSLSEKTDKLLMNMNRKSLIAGDSYDFSIKINELENEISSLQSGVSAPINKIIAPESGFFVSMTDGYENLLTTDDLTKYTPEFFENINEQKVDAKDGVGKLVSDYKWYIAATLDINDALKYKPGDSVKLKTSFKDNPTLSVRVAAVNNSYDANQSVIVFSCQKMNNELASVRFAAMTIVSGEYEGLKINQKAVRVSDSLTGVYVVSGMELKFVTVNILYAGENYCICEKTDSTENNVLRLYDKIVVKGKNLYDGKIIN